MSEEKKAKLEQEEEKKESKKQNTISKITNSSKSIKDLISNVAIVLLIIVSIFFVFKDSRKTIFSIKSIDVPSEFVKKGLDGKNLTSILKNELNKIRHLETDYSILKEDLEYFIDAKRKNYAIKDPITGFNISSLKSYIQDVVFNNQKEISGFITTHNEGKIQLHIDLGGKFLSVYELKDSKDIESIMQQVAEDFIKLYEDKYVLGLHYLVVKKDYKNCFKIIQELLNDDDASNDHKAYYLRGLIYLKSYPPNLQLAKKNFSDVVKNAPNPALGFNGLGRVYERSASIDTAKTIMHWDSATQMYKKAITSDKQLSGPLLNLGNIYLRKYLSNKDQIFLDSAEICYRKSIALNKNDAIAYGALGTCLLQRKNDEGLNAFEKAIQINPFTPLPYLQRGGYYIEIKDSTKAAFDIKQAEECYLLDSIKYAGFKRNIFQFNQKLKNINQ